MGSLPAPESFLSTSTSFRRLVQRHANGLRFRGTVPVEHSRRQAASEAIAVTLLLQLETAGAETIELLAKLVPIEGRVVFRSQADPERFGRRHLQRGRRCWGLSRLSANHGWL